MFKIRLCWNLLHPHLELPQRHLETSPEYKVWCEREECAFIKLSHRASCDLSEWASRLSAVGPGHKAKIRCYCLSVLTLFLEAQRQYQFFPEPQNKSCGWGPPLTKGMHGQMFRATNPSTRLLGSSLPLLLPPIANLYVLADFNTTVAGKTTTVFDGSWHQSTKDQTPTCNDL